MTGWQAVAVSQKTCYSHSIMTAAYTGHVVIVMAPMGSGKGTVIQYARERFPELRTTVSCTTRASRPGEVDGQDYHFLTREAFLAKIDAGEFLEWAEFGGNLYGTLQSEILPPITRGEIVIAEIEVQGVEQLRTLLPAAVMTTIYIEAGGWDELRRRALARAEMSQAELKRRHERYLVELQTKAWADLIIDNTGDDFTPACERFAEFIESLYRAKATT